MRRGENPNRRCRATTAPLHRSDSALREASGAEKRSRNREAMRQTLEREKASLSDEGTKAPNENKMSDGGLGRASLEVEVWKSSQMRTQSGPPFAPSHG